MSPFCGRADVLALHGAQHVPPSALVRPTSISLKGVTSVFRKLHLASARPRPAQQLRAQGDESVSGQTAEEEPSAPLAAKFGSKFAAVLQGALERSGGDTALFTSDALAGSKEPEPPGPTAMEEVLGSALRQSRRNLLMMEQLTKQVKEAHEREKKQFERLHFAYQKATSDAAYARTMEKMLARERANRQPSE